MKIDYNIKAEHERNYRERWESKTTHQIKREIKSWRSYMQKHSGSYGWIETNPNELSDGDKLNILRDILSARGESC